MGSQRVRHDRVSMQAHIHHNGQSRKHLGPGNLHHMLAPNSLCPWHQLDQAQRRLKATVSEVTAAEVGKDNHLAPRDNQECQTLFEGESDIHIFMDTSLESHHLPASATDPKYQLSLHLSGHEHKHAAGRKTGINRKAPYCSSSPRKSWKGRCRGCSPAPAGQTHDYPWRSALALPSFLFRQKSPGVLFHSSCSILHSYQQGTWLPS